MRENSNVFWRSRFHIWLVLADFLTSVKSCGIVYYCVSVISNEQNILDIAIQYLIYLYLALVAVHKLVKDG